MKKELRIFFTALAFFTRIPCATWSLHHHENLNRATKYFPLVGVIVGAVAALVYIASSRILSPPLAVLLSMASSLLFTGAFHEDGLADSADGLGGGWEKEQILAIMKDSHIGSYGVVTLIMALLTKFQTLSNMPPLLVPAILVAGHSLSRLAAVTLIYNQNYVRENGKAKALAQHISGGEWLLAAIFGLAPLLLLDLRLWWAMLPVVLAGLWFARILAKRLGGYTGDCLGAMQQLCELAFYLGVLACISR